MRRFESYLAEAVKLIDGYNGKMPFHVYSKTYFSLHKKFGSTDRKIISQLCYYFFRVCHAVSGEKKEVIIAGIFLCENAEVDLLEYFDPALNKKVSKTLLQKLEILKLNPDSLFPFKDEVSEQIDFKKFSISFLIQPSLYLRIRPGKKFNVIKKLEESDIEFNSVKDWVQFDNSEKVDSLITLNKNAVVQDLNSQRVFDFFDKNGFKNEINVWDCCAASGGKSILIYDRLKGRVKLTTSDVRQSILDNLKKRLHQANVPVKKSFVADLSKPVSLEEKFDLIICDAPCTGSGTWARTPEQLYLFKKNTIANYSELQKKIISNSISALKPQGLFCYITCSVFKEENEEIVKFISSEFKIENIYTNYFKGYETKADTLFVSIFKLIS